MTHHALWVVLLALAGCRTHDDSDGHHHGAGPEALEDLRPDETVTLYQGSLELFMKYPAFVSGSESPLVAHFTDVRDPETFHAVIRGQLTATLRFKDGSEQVFLAERPLRDGIFKPIVKPTKAGNATLTLALTGEQVAGVVEVGEVVVYATVEAAVAAVAEEAPAGEQSVPYLKEQQWKTVYATAPAEKRALRDSVRVFGELRTAAGRHAELSAPIGGRVEVSGPIPRLGDSVKRGALILTLTPAGAAGGADRSGLELEERRARAELGLAVREQQRASDLFAAQAIAEKLFDAARVAVEVAEARQRSASAQLAAFRSVQGSQGSGRATAFELRAPLDGVVSRVSIMPGTFVSAGAPLLTVVDSSELWLVAHVPEQDVARVAEVGGAAFRVEGQETEQVVDATARVGVSPVLDPATRTLAVVFGVANPGGGLRAGMSARVALYEAVGPDTVAVPRQALVDDSGSPAVFLMEGGESFFKRRVQLGIREGDWVEVKTGLKPGDRVVSRGVFEVKLSTTAGAIPAHGHQH